MSEENTQEPQAQANGQDQDKAAPSFAVRRIYLKDLSFETPMGLEAFNQKQPPKIEQELNVQVNRVDENHHEVVLLLTITAKMEEKVAFLIEVKQAGISPSAAWIKPPWRKSLTLTARTFCSPMRAKPSTVF